MIALQDLAIAFQLVQNAALLALGVIGYCQIRPWLQRRVPSAPIEAWLYGLAFGAFGVLSMLASIDAGSGVRLDLRNAIVAVATIFGGLTAGALATAVTVLFRMALGGGGIVGGIVALLVTYAVSAVDLIYVRRRAAAIDVRNLLALGIAVGIAALILAGLFPQTPAVQQIVHQVAPVWAVLLPLTVLFLGAIICHFERSQALDRALRDHISDLKRAEQTVRHSEARFRALIENSNDVIGVLSAEGNFRYRCPTKAEGLGYGAQLDIPMLDLVHPDDRSAAAAALQSVAAESGAHRTGRSRMRHKDGSWRHIAWSLWNASDVPGVGGIVFNIVDITDTQRLEEQLLQAQKMEAIGRLAGGIAHDFNNILGAILGFAGFLREDLPKGSPEHGFAERIVRAGERARDLVQQILSFSRRSDIKRAPQDVGRLVIEARDLLQAAVAKSTRLEMQVATDALIADVNVAQVSQVLMNLVINANDALMGEPGMVRIEVGPVNPGDADYDGFRRSGGSNSRPDEGVDLFVGALDAGRAYARLAVTDTGIGIEAAVANNIFDPFFTTKERGRGTGLGLAVVQGIVATYGGAMTVTSRRGRGSTFAAYLPLSTALVPAAPAISAAAPELRGRERILVIDDEADIRDMLAVGLDRLGYEVIAVDNPEDAAAAFQADPTAWDVVVSDEVMPQMRGMTLFHRLKQINPRLRFILCTGFSGSTTEDVAKQAGIDAYFVKPVSADQIAAGIRAVVDSAGDSQTAMRSAV